MKARYALTSHTHTDTLSFLCAHRLTLTESRDAFTILSCHRHNRSWVYINFVGVVVGLIASILLLLLLSGGSCAKLFAAIAIAWKSHAFFILCVCVPLSLTFVLLSFVLIARWKIAFAFFSVSAVVNFFCVCICRCCCCCCSCRT